MMKTRVFLSSWILVIFLQSLRVTFSTLFGVIYDQIFEGPMSAWLLVSNVLVVLALLAPGLLARKVSKSRLTLFAITALLARMSLSIDDANIRYWGALIVLATAGSYFALMLRVDRKHLASALIWGILWEYLLRVLGDTFDVSLFDGSLPYTILGGLAIIGFALWIDHQKEQMNEAAPGINWAQALGLGAFLFLQTSLLALPSAVARYSTITYMPIALLLYLASAAVLIPEVRRVLDPLFALQRARWALMLLVGLGFTSGYFLEGWLAAGGLILAQGIVVAGVVFAIIEPEAGKKDSHWRLPIGFLWMLVLNFLGAFAFTYSYTLPVMREMGWVVYLIAILVFAWCVIAPPTREAQARSKGSSLDRILVLITAIMIVIAVWPGTTEPLPKGSLRLATWNIHYGYDDDWHTNLQEMAGVIAAEGVDVIALQEVDTGRMTSYSSDNAYFLARRLGMQVVYLPAVEHLTGIALLYKGPQAASDVTFLTSLQEQTGVVHAALDWGVSGLDAYGIWMGLSDEDTQRQMDEALAFIGSAATASLGGDFNARPEDPEIAAVRASGFADPYDLLGITDPPMTSPAIDPQERIDFVWLRGLIPQRVWVSTSLASDHRMVVVEVNQP